MGVITKARNGLGTAIMITGFILLFGAGILILIWTLAVLTSAYGWWGLLIGLVLAPITDVLSLFIVWFATGYFPYYMLIIYVLGLVGMGIVALGTFTRKD